MSKKILVVDDELDMVLVLVKRLKNHGYETVSAFNGEEALKIIKQHKFDLIILDIMMPIMYGTELAQALKECSAEDLAGRFRTDDVERELRALAEHHKKTMAFFAGIALDAEPRAVVQACLQAHGAQVAAQHVKAVEVDVRVAVFDLPLYFFQLEKAVVQPFLVLADCPRVPGPVILA